MKRKEINVYPYDPSWKQIFDVESQIIQKALGLEFVEIHHIGSTSVEGLVAKKDIDILCVVRDLAKTIELLEKAGYTFKGELNIPLRYFYSKNTDFSKVNLHVVERDHGFIKLNLTFRDYLREHPETKEAYGQLKKKILESEDAGVRVGPRFTRYGLEKDEFIKSVLKDAGYRGEIVNICLHHKDWEEFDQLIFDAYGVDKGQINRSYDFKSSSNQAYCMIYSSGTEIVSAAYVLLEGAQLKIKYLATKDHFQKREIEQKFKAFLEKWSTKLSSNY